MSHLNEVLTNKSPAFEKADEGVQKVKYNEEMVYNYDDLVRQETALAKELAPAVCVNAIAPGIVTWPGNFDEADKQRQLSFIPVKRIAEPQEITKAVIFLLINDYITGQVLNVDGGRCI